MAISQKSKQMENIFFSLYIRWCLRLVIALPTRTLYHVDFLYFSLSSTRNEPFSKFKLPHYLNHYMNFMTHELSLIKSNFVFMICELNYLTLWFEKASPGHQNKMMGNRFHIQTVNLKKQMTVARAKRRIK